MKRDALSSFPMDYDAFAPTYAWTRVAVPWALEPLARIADDLGPGSIVCELGCGTGNYVHALAARYADLDCIGVDLSQPMLREASRRPAAIAFVRADAERAVPLRDRACALVFAVDVIHHIARLDVFFEEAARILAPGGRLVLVTDSEETLSRRSLTHYFPELLSIEVARYPAIETLREQAGAAGFQRIDEAPASGAIPLTDEFVARLAAKCSSAMRLMRPEDHAAGVARVRSGQSRGEQWFSCYTVLTFGVAGKPVDEGGE